MRLLRRVSSWSGGLALLACADIARATMYDADFVETLFVTSAGGDGATSFGWFPDSTNRLLVARQGGTILVVENGVVLPTPFATVSPLETRSECGLIGLAFDPDFVTNHYVYALVTATPTEQRIVRWTEVGNVGTSMTTIVGGLPTRDANHNGGGMAFGPDARLYWGIGDNGAGVGADDDLISLAAKIGRANRDGTAPKDNPFFDGAGPNQDLIWARGFRNPFKLAFSPVEEKLWVDVAGETYEQIFRVARGEHAGWIRYENNQPSGYLEPVVSYVSHGVESTSIAAGAAVRAAGTVTVRTVSPHHLHRGATVTLSGMSDTTFDTTGYVAREVDATTFTMLQAGGDATSGGGLVTAQTLGSVLTGGGFYDSTIAPAGYRGNFFFCDFFSGRVMRVKLDASEDVQGVDYWASAYSGCLDARTGPDGDLYFLDYHSEIYRAAYQPKSQVIVASPAHRRMIEGGKATIAVRLGRAPSSATIVSLARTSGDSDVTITAGGTLTFGPDDWATPRIVTLAAAQDPDSVDDEAFFDATSPGIPIESVRVRVTDDDPVAILVTPLEVTMSEGGTATLHVSLSAAPDGPVDVVVARSAGDPDVTIASGAVLHFDAANFAVAQSVVVADAIDPDAIDDAATLSLTGGSLPARTVPVTVRDGTGLDAGPTDADSSAATDAGFDGGDDAGFDGGDDAGPTGTSESTEGSSCGCRFAGNEGRARWSAAAGALWALWALRSSRRARS